MSIKNIVDLPIEHKTPTDRLYDFQGETAFVEFHEGAQSEGYVLVFDGEIDDFVHRDFSITFHSDSFENDVVLKSLWTKWITMKSCKQIILYDPDSKDNQIQFTSQVL